MSRETCIPVFGIASHTGACYHLETDIRSLTGYGETIYIGSEKER